MPRRRNPFRLLLALCLLAIVLVAIAYIVGLAWLQSREEPHLAFADLIVPRIVDVILVAWLAFVGASIGSFLNVVAWRMPQGRSVQGRSFCPRCHTRLRARDNFPVFGWLALGGRCRSCRLPISPRYPIVELLVGITITVMGVAEIYRLSLPFDDAPASRTPLSAPLIDLPLIATVVYHLVALSFSWAYGLIRLDGNRLPGRLAALGVAATVLPMVIYPTLMCVPWQVRVPADWRDDGMYVDAVIRVLTAAAAAGLFGRVLAKSFCPTADLKLDPLGRATKRLLDLVLVISVPAIIVGWQPLPAVLLIASLLAWASERVLGPAVDALGRFAIAMPLAMTFQLMLWRPLHQAPFWPSVGSDPYLILVAGGLVLLVPLWLRDEDSSSLPGTA